MIGSCPPVGQTLKKGLEQAGHSVTLVDDPSVFDDDVKAEYPLKWSLGLRKGFGDDYPRPDGKLEIPRYNVVHVHSPNLKKCLLAYPYVRAGVPLVCHWHGSDLRLFWKSWPAKQWCIKHAKMNIYSTCDLAWWLRDSPKRLINCPVNCDVFKPGETAGDGLVTFDGGAKAFRTHRVPHKEMPEYLRRYQFASIHNAMGLDDNLYSIIAFEAAACGLIVLQFPFMNREWVLSNASIPVITKQLLQVYKEVGRSTDR